MSASLVYYQSFALICTGIIMNLPRLIAANIVVLANSFNASIATKDWLLKHVIADEPNDYMITPVVAVYKTDKIDLLVDQSRLQVVCNQLDEACLELCSEVVSSYVRNLPHTPYIAVGLNYVLEIAEPTIDFQSKLAGALGDLSSAFVEYSIGPNIVGTKDGSRISITVDPSLEPNSPLRVRVNYHYDCQEAEMVAEKAQALRSIATDIVSLVPAVLFGGGR